MALALIVSVRKLCPYFQAYDIIVPKDTHLKQVLFKPEVADQLKNGRLNSVSLTLSMSPIQQLRAG